MLECSSESPFLVNAEVDSMGGVVDCGVGTGIKTSPCRAEIEKAQEKIRLEIDCREEQLRELEFLLKGGDPLDFKFSHAVSVSVQSTLLTDQHPKQIIKSKTNDSYMSIDLRSPHREDVESFGKSGDTTCEANSGDNLLLIVGDNKFLKDKNSKRHSSKNTVAPSEISARSGGNHKAKGSQNSANFRPYYRRNQSISNRDGVKSGSRDVAHARNNQGSTRRRPCTRDVKGSLSDANSKYQKLSSICKLKSFNRVREMVQKNDSLRNLESVKMPTVDKFTSAAHGSEKELAISVEAKNNGDLLGIKNNHEKFLDDGSCGARIDVDERKTLANCGSCGAGIASQSDAFKISKKMNCTQKDRESGYPDSTTVNLGVHYPKIDSDAYPNQVTEDFNGNYKDPEDASKSVTEYPLEIKINTNSVDPGSVAIGGSSVYHDNESSSVIKVEEDEDLHRKSVMSESLMMTELKELNVLEVHKIQGNMNDYNSNPRNGDTAVQTSTTSPPDDVSDTIRYEKGATDKDVPDAAFNKILADKMDEGSVLAEAKIIQAKWKRIAELAMKSLPLENCRKSHWDFLLEEVAWLANDFMQERLWKVTAAAQISCHTVLSSHLRNQKQMHVQRLKFVAHSMAKAVMEFWHSFELREGPALLEHQGPYASVALRNYALRFLRFNSSTVTSIKAEDPVILSDMDDSGMQETSGESCISEGDLFYVIPPRTTQCYRTSIESFVLQREKIDSTQKVDGTPMYDLNEEMSKDNIYDEDEGETNTHCPSGNVDWTTASKLPHKKQKGLKRTYTSGSYELGPDLTHGSHASGTQNFVFMAKRPATPNDVSISTKRMRTASRQRVLGSSSGVGTVNSLSISKTDTSSGDANSYQDDQSSLYGGSQGGHSNTRLDNLHLDSNGSNGSFGQHRNKRLKVSKQTRMLGSIPLSAASHMSNMPNANEYKRMIANRDSLRKAKDTKVSVPMSGSGSAWISFEDQALVVLVHDLGPNWDLISDAINSTLQLKHIYRGPKECKERHKVLMDQTAGDGADSADKSRSCQPYSSTMPGIPKGSARQLFQRLHGPMEEDMVKSDFEKIIRIGQKLHRRRKQCESHDQKHVTPPHHSHVIAISQVSSNNLNGGFLMPLDLIDAIISSPDVLSLGCQCLQTNGLTNQSCLPSVLPPPGVNSVQQGSVGTSAGNNFASPSGPLSHRNGRLGVSRASVPVDDQQRVQQLNPLLSGRNIQQSTMPEPGSHPVADRFGLRKLQSGNGMSVVNGISNRGMPMSRPGFQGLCTSAMLDSGAVLSTGMVGMPTLEMQSAIGSSQGNSMQKPLDSSHLIRPGWSVELNREKMVPELQMLATQSNSHCITPINGLNGSYTALSGPSSNQSSSVHLQQKHQISLQQSHDVANPHHAHLRGSNHVIGSQHPAYARLVKERQLQKQQILQQQQQCSASNTMMSQTQPQPSQGISHSSIWSSSPMTPIYSEVQLRHHLRPHVRDSQSGASSLPNQITKQRQRHPLQQQSVRLHTSQQLQSQHGKQLKEEGKETVPIPHYVTVDQSNMNGQSLSPITGVQFTNKGEGTVRPSRSLGLQTSSPMQQVPPMLDNGNQNLVPCASYVTPFDQTRVNILRGAESSDLIVDDCTENSDALSVGNAATTTRPQFSMELIEGNFLATPQWQAPESLLESGMQNVSSQLGSIGSPPTKSPGSDSNQAVSPGSI